MSIAEDLANACDKALEEQRLLGASLLTPSTDGTVFLTTATVPGSHQSLADLDSELTTIATSIRAISEQDLTFVPLKTMQSASKKLAQIAGHYAAARAEIPDTETTQTITAETFTFVDQNGTGHTLGPHLKSASDATEELLTDWHLLRLAAKSPRINDFAAFLRLNAEHRATLEKLLQEAIAIKENVKEADTSIDAILSDTTEAKSEIAGLKEITDSDRKTISAMLAEASTKMEGIKKTSLDADALTNTIAEYQSEFDRFQGQLDERTKRFTDGTTQLTQLIERLNHEESTIKRLIDQSEGMLTGATNAGLAGSLSQRLKEISKEVTRSRWAYYAAITILIAATLPIAFDILPKEFAQKILKTLTGGYFDASTSNDKLLQNPDLLGHVIARALLLIPPLLLVRFSAARHERLFRLREHYAYKYSIASSVEGFKQQSPEQYRDYIALTAFNELTFNPATQMESKGSETKHPNPLIDAFLKKAGFAPEQQA
ncbi:hypothetical protein SAMN03159423_2730 [Bradyrhizobium sp. NFR13]|uniref:hypothetical protein n=1 Tax=Bradyrhizobium sp. NFR13 TaxID=1566285 RepID=UPI0008E6009A|nr:hypothetical protein [Bradyrhizobium sp. NFR13]SFL59842.1 hypothetical protein SAMN03159423_2730 [Bradyrhizobium sp. NFR13]